MFSDSDDDDEDDEADGKPDGDDSSKSKLTKVDTTYVWRFLNGLLRTDLPSWLHVKSLTMLEIEEICHQDQMMFVLFQNLLKIKLNVNQIHKKVMYNFLIKIFMNIKGKMELNSSTISCKYGLEVRKNVERKQEQIGKNLSDIINQN